MTALPEGAPVLAASALIALLLVAEAGLLIGMAMPGASLALGLGAISVAGGLPLFAAILVAATATVLGASLGHRTASRHRTASLVPPPGGIGRLLPRRLVRTAQRLAASGEQLVGRRPVRTAAIAQLVGGGRTLAPRIAARAGVPLLTMLRGTLPAALLWSCSLVMAGALTANALPPLRTVLIWAGILVVVAATALLHRRRAARQPDQPRSPITLVGAGT